MRLREKLRLNDRVAMMLMGWVRARNGLWLDKQTEVSTGFASAPGRGDYIPYFDPATNIRHAWMVLETMQTKQDGKSYAFWAELQLACILVMKERNAAQTISRAAIKYCK